MKATLISVVIALALIGGVVLIANNSSPTTTDRGTNENVSVVDGVQIVTIRAKGGYHPRKSVATAGLPTVVRFETNGTFDCSSAIRIPSLGISQYLPQNGQTDISIGTHQASTLKGSCGMGMYPFEIEFI